MTALLPAARGRADAAVTTLLVAAFGLLPLLSVRLTKTVAFSDVALVLAALLLLVHGPMGRAPLRTVPRWLVVGVVLLAIGGVVALLFAPLPLDSAVLLGRLLVAAGLACFLLLWWDPPAASARLVLTSYVVGATLSAALGALSATLLLDATDRWRDVIDRSTGLTGNANHLGAVTAIGICLALGLAATTRRRPVAAALLVAVAIMGAAVLWSGSRSALVGVLTGAAVVGARLWVERRRTPLLVVAGAATLVLLLGVVGVVRIPAVDRLLLRTDTTASTYSVESTEVRWELARARVESAGASSLIVGSGMENRDTEGGHSGHLEIWVGTGLLGLSGWVVVCVGTLAVVVRSIRRRGRLTAADAVVITAGAGFAAHLGSTLFLEHIWDRYIWMLVALVVLLRPADASVEPEAEPDPEPGAEAAPDQA